MFDTADTINVASVAEPQSHIELAPSLKPWRTLRSFRLLKVLIYNTSHKFWNQPPSSFSVASLPISCNIEQGKGVWFISVKWIIPEFLYIFLGIDLVSIIYARYCHKIWGNLRKFEELRDSINWEEWAWQINVILCNTL